MLAWAQHDKIKKNGTSFKRLLAFLAQIYIQPARMLCDPAEPPPFFFKTKRAEKDEREGIELFFFFFGIPDPVIPQMKERKQTPHFLNM